jgi:hypothetical protein
VPIVYAQFRIDPSSITRLRLETKEGLGVWCSMPWMAGLAIRATLGSEAFPPTYAMSMMAPSERMEGVGFARDMAQTQLVFDSGPEEALA